MSKYYTIMPDGQASAETHAMQIQEITHHCDSWTDFDDVHTPKKI